MKKGLRRCIILLLMGLLVLSTGTLPVMAALDIKVGYYEYDGFVSVDEEKRIVGYAGEVLAHFVEANPHWNFVPVLLERGVFMDNMRKGFAILSVQSPESTYRARYLTYSQQAVGKEYGIFYSGFQDSLYYEDFAAFDGMIVGTIEADMQTDLFNDYQAAKGFTVEYRVYNSLAEMKEALSTGEIQGLIYGSTVEQADLRIIARYAEVPLHVAVNTWGESFMESIDRTLNGLVAEDPTYFDQLYDKYFGNAPQAMQAMTRAEEQAVAEEQRRREEEEAARQEEARLEEERRAAEAAAAALQPEGKREKGALPTVTIAISAFTLLAVLVLGNLLMKNNRKKGTKADQAAADGGKMGLGLAGSQEGAQADDQENGQVDDKSLGLPGRSVGEQPFKTMAMLLEDQEAEAEAEVDCRQEWDDIGIRHEAGDIEKAGIVDIVEEAEADAPAVAEVFDIVEEAEADAPAAGAVDIVEEAEADAPAAAGAIDIVEEAEADAPAVAEVFDIVEGVEGAITEAGTAQELAVAAAQAVAAKAARGKADIPEEAQGEDEDGSPEHLMNWITAVAEEPDEAIVAADREYTEEEIRGEIYLSGLTISLQPRYSINRNEVVGAEVSVSCRHPIRDRIFPEELVASLSKKGKLYMLDRYIFESLCLCQPQQRLGDTQGFAIAIPIFAESVIQPDFSQWYIRTALYYEIDPRLIRLDLVYTWPASRDSQVYSTLHDLTTAGFRLALKEVGDSNYPLNIFSEVDFEALVVAEKLVIESLESVKKRRLLQALKSLCSQMGFRLEADRIDSREKFQLLTELGCQVFQGNFLTRPIPLEQFWEYKRKLDIRRGQ